MEPGEEAQGLEVGRVAAMRNSSIQCASPCTWAVIFLIPPRSMAMDTVNGLSGRLFVLFRKRSFTSPQKFLPKTCFGPARKERHLKTFFRKASFTSISKRV